MESPVWRQQKNLRLSDRWPLLKPNSGMAIMDEQLRVRVVEPGSGLFGWADSRPFFVLRPWGRGLRGCLRGCPRLGVGLVWLVAGAFPVARLWLACSAPWVAWWGGGWWVLAGLSGPGWASSFALVVFLLGACRGWPAFVGVSPLALPFPVPSDPGIEWCCAPCCCRFLVHLRFCVHYGPLCTTPPGIPPAPARPLFGWWGGLGGGSFALAACLLVGCCLVGGGCGGGGGLWGVVWCGGGGWGGGGGCWVVAGGWGVVGVGWVGGWGGGVVGGVGGVLGGGGGGVGGGGGCLGFGLVWGLVVGGWGGGGGLGGGGGGGWVGGGGGGGGGGGVSPKG